MEIEIQYSSRWFKQHASTIEHWYSKESYDWHKPGYLIEFCYDTFELWYHKDILSQVPEFIRADYNQLLGKHCINHIDTWYDPRYTSLTKEQILCKELYQ